MATVNRIVDDYNHDLDAQTRTFELLGQTFEIDIADANLDFFSGLVNNAQELVKKARPVNGRSEPKNRQGGISSNRGSDSNGKTVSVSRKKSTRPRSSAKNTRAKKAVNGAPPSVVRKWAQDNKVEVSATGVIQQATYDAYNKAHANKE